MTRWITTVEEQGKLYSQVGLRLLDELTDSAPIGKTTQYLDLLSPGNTWQKTDISSVTTPTGLISYPGLERHFDVTGRPPRHYRVRVEAEFYIPLYRKDGQEGVDFPRVFPYNDSNPPQVITRSAVDTFLTPAPNYPFPDHISVVRGVVVDATGKPVPDAFVTQGNRERVVTDKQGSFALPLRWAQQNVEIPVDAVDHTGRVGSINIKLPDALSKSQKIQIN